MTEPTTTPFTIKGVTLLSIAVCAAKEQMRFALNATMLRPAKVGTGTVIEATNGRVLARLHIDLPAPGTYAFSHDLLKRIKADDDVEIANGVLTIRALMLRVDLLPPEGAFPDTDSVIPAMTREGSPVIGAGEPFSDAFAVLKKLGVESCRFGIGKADEAVLITAPTVYGRLEIAVMPISTDETEKFAKKSKKTKTK